MAAQIVAKAVTKAARVARDIATNPHKYKELIANIDKDVQGLTKDLTKVQQRIVTAGKKRSKRKRSKRALSRKRHKSRKKSKRAFSRKRHKSRKKSKRKSGGKRRKKRRKSKK